MKNRKIPPKFTLKSLFVLIKADGEISCCDFKFSVVTLISWSSCCCWMDQNVVTTNETGPTTFAPNDVDESLTPWIRTYFPNYRTNFPLVTGLFPLTTACLVWSWVIFFRNINATFL